MGWASYQIRKFADCACAGNAGNAFPRRRIQRKTRVSDPGMHHGTCVTHVPWCMSGLLTRGGGENVPGIPGACAPAILRIWQEAHEIYCSSTDFNSFGNRVSSHHFIIGLITYPCWDLSESIHYLSKRTTAKLSNMQYTNTFRRWQTWWSEF